MPLEDDLLAAADTLVEAWHLLRGGHVERTARLADDAVELAIKAVIPLPEELRPKPGHPVAASRMYRYRREQAARRFGIPPKKTERLHDHRLVDRFREESAGGPPAVLTEPQAVESLESATQAFLTVVNSSEVPPETRARVVERLGQRNDPSMEEEVLELVEHNVGWGHYHQGLHARLLRLDRVFATRPSTVGQGHHARVVTLRAHMAMNEGRPEGPDGAIALGARASSMWEVRRDRARIIHSLMIQSIGWRILRDPMRGRPLMELARDVAGDAPNLMDTVNAEWASLLLAVNEPEGAARALSDRLGRAYAEGRHVQEGRTREQMGKALMLAGRFPEAERMLLRAHALTPPDYLIAECVCANTLAELYAQMGEKRDAHLWAERVERLARGLGFRHQLRELEEMMRRYPTIW